MTLATKHDTWISVVGALRAITDDMADVKETDNNIVEDALDDAEEYPLIPWCDTADDEFRGRWVDYSDRGPRDVVVSGPILGGWGPGRWHRSRRVAYWRLVRKYGEDRVKQMRQSEGRWSFLIKNLKEA